MSAAERIPGMMKASLSRHQINQRDTERKADSSELALRVRLAKFNHYPMHEEAIKHLS